MFRKCSLFLRISSRWLASPVIWFSTSKKVSEQISFMSFPIYYLKGELFRELVDFFIKNIFLVTVKIALHACAVFSMCWGGDDGGGVKSVLALQNKNHVGNLLGGRIASPHQGFL